MKRKALAILATVLIALGVAAPHADASPNPDWVVVANSFHFNDCASYASILCAAPNQDVVTFKIDSLEGRNYNTWDLKRFRLRIRDEGGWYLHGSDWSAYPRTEFWDPSYDEYRSDGTDGRANCYVDTDMVAGAPVGQRFVLACLFPKGVFVSGYRYTFTAVGVDAGNQQQATWVGSAGLLYP